MEVSDILLEIESSLADPQTVQLMLSNLKDDINYSKEINAGKPFELKITKKEINELFNESVDVDVALICPKCNNFMFDNDEDAKLVKFNEKSNQCCKDYYNKSHKISKMNLDYWFYFSNDPFQTIEILPNYTRFLFYSTEGIPTQLRSRIWGLLLDSCNTLGEINNDWAESLFENLNQENSPYLRIINNDLNRIFPNLQYFQNKELGQENLKKILNAYSLYDSEIGYCQGLSFLISLLLFHFKSNPITFLSTIKIFEKKKNINFKKIFDEKMSGLELWFYQFTEIFEKHNIELFNYFKNLNIDLKLFTSKWFLSFFAVGCPMQILIKLFDVMIIEGFQSSIFKISLIILHKNMEKLMELSGAEEIYQFLLSRNIWDVYGNNLIEIIEDLLKLNPNLVSENHLNELEEKFNKNKEKSGVNNSLNVSPKKNIGHRYTKSTSNLSVNVTKANNSNNNNNNVNNNATDDINVKSLAPTQPHNDEGDSSFFKFFKYGFSNPGTPILEHHEIEEPQPTLEKLILEEDEKSNNNNSGKSAINNNSNCSTRSSTYTELFDSDSLNDVSSSSNASTNSPVDANNRKPLVREIIITDHDENSLNTNVSTSTSINDDLLVAAKKSNSTHSNLSNSFSCSSQLSDQINYLSAIPPPNVKPSTVSCFNNNSSTSSLPNSPTTIIGESIGHSRSMSELNDFEPISGLAISNIEDGKQVTPNNTNTGGLGSTFGSWFGRGSTQKPSKPAQHQKNTSISNSSIFSNSTDASTLYSSHIHQSSTFSPPSQLTNDGSFGNFDKFTNASPAMNRRLSSHHKYNASISSISSVGNKTRSEMKEMELMSEIELLKYKLESFEKVIDDDKKLIKNLFKLYLIKDELLDKSNEKSEDVSDEDKSKLENKIKKKEYKVLKEVEERLKL